MSDELPDLSTLIQSRSAASATRMATPFVARGKCHCTIEVVEGILTVTESHGREQVDGQVVVVTGGGGVIGRAIFFSTLINAGGFLAFALSDLPPIRQFGSLAAIAFTLSMIADFTALPAALWLVFRAKPESLQK